MAAAARDIPLRSSMFQRVSRVSGQSGARGPWQREGYAFSGRMRTRGPLIKRWIGASQRRAERAIPEEPHGGGEIIRLTWKQTFGRPSVSQDQAAGETVDLAGPAVLLRPRPCA